jgi:hypothetical protein
VLSGEALFDERADDPRPDAGVPAQTLLFDRAVEFAELVECE